MNDYQGPEAMELLHRLAHVDKDAGAIYRGAGAPPLLGPAQNPCISCPYRKDVPSGVWAEKEYRKLPAFDRPTAEQPSAVWACHQTSPEDPKLRVCAGWVGVHGQNPRGRELLALRMAPFNGSIDPQDLHTTLTYRTKIPLWPSGQAAMEHGLRDLDDPSPEAIDLRNKIVRRRPETAAHKPAPLHQDDSVTETDAP